MQNVAIRVAEGFLPEFKDAVDSLIRSGKLEIVEDCPSELIYTSASEVRRSVFEAEDQVNRGEFCTKDEYTELIRGFFKKKENSL